MDFGPTTSQISHNTVWLRYGIALSLTALFPIAYGFGKEVLPPPWLPSSIYTMGLLTRFINVKYHPPDNRYRWLTDDRHLILALINLAVALLCCGVAIAFLKEIPPARMFVLLESRATPWFCWGVFGLLQLREHLQAKL